MKNFNLKLLAVLEIAAIPAMLTVVSCGSDPAAVNYVQIERLARPGINELLVYTNASHEAYNAIDPNIDLTDAAASVRTEVATILGALDTAAGGTSSTPPLAQVVSGFLPDVMRIDTNTASGYGACISSTNVILCGGRKIHDDVIQISYEYLISGGTTGSTTFDDGVTYDGDRSNLATNCPSDAASPNGTNDAAPGHRCLNGQTTRASTGGTFPFLARPN